MASLQKGAQGERKGRGRIARAARRVGRGAQLRRRLPPRVAPPPRRRRWRMTRRSRPWPAREPCVHAMRLAAADRTEAYRQLAAIRHGLRPPRRRARALDAAVDEARRCPRCQGRRRPHRRRRPVAAARARSAGSRARARPRRRRRRRARAAGVVDVPCRRTDSAYAALGDWEKATPPWELAMPSSRATPAAATLSAHRGGGARRLAARTVARDQCRGRGRRARTTFTVYIVTRPCPRMVISPFQNPRWSFPHHTISSRDYTKTCSAPIGLEP